MLNPRLKWTIFRKWDDEDKESARHALSRLWKNKYRSNTGIPKCTSHFFSSDNIYLQWFAKHEIADNEHEMDELENYLRAHIPIDIGNVSARKWWLESF